MAQRLTLLAAGLALALVAGTVLAHDARQPDKDNTPRAHGPTPAEPNS